MKIIITPEAQEFVLLYNSEINILNYISKAIQFENSIFYRENIAMAQLHPYVRPISYIKNKIGFCHWVAEKKLLIFLPTKNRRDMGTQFFNKQFAIGHEFVYS